MRAFFDVERDPVRWIESDGKLYIFIALNGSWTLRSYDESVPPHKCWECDYREIVTTPSKIDLEDVKAHPEEYLAWEEPEDDPLTDIQLALAELYEMIGG